MTGLQSAGLRLIQGEKHIDTIRDIVSDYTEREPNVILKHPDGNDDGKKGAHFRSGWTLRKKRPHSIVSTGRFRG